MPHISLVTLGVGDLDRAVAFYEALGWRRSPASVPGTVAFFHGTPVLALFGRDALADDAGLPVAPVAVPGATALAMNVATPDEVDKTLAAAEAAGAMVSQPARDTDWGGRSGYFLDPDAHLWEVAHNPGFGLLPDGRVELPGD